MRTRGWWLAGFILASILTSIVPYFTHAQGRPANYGKFVIYYGWYSDQSGRLGGDIYQIIKSNPDFVISPFYNSAGRLNLSPQVMDLYHQNGIKVLAYVATGNAQRNLDTVRSEITNALKAGADGVMLDEVSGLNSQAEVDYYQSIYNLVKQGGDKIVVANPGTILVSEKIMNMTDILSFEHQWRLAPQLDWFSKYPASRYMGVSSNDVSNVMGYPVDGSVAARDTIEAWQRGIGYHYSTDSYTNLPSWFEQYQSGINSYYQSAAANMHKLSVKTQSEDGTDIRGLWIEVRKNGALVSTGFSPAEFALPGGQYQVWASNYESLQFSKWNDGSASPVHALDMNTNQSITAVYKSRSASLDIETVDTLGNHIKGLSVRVFHGGTSVAAGYTPLHISLPLGKYTVQALSYRFYQFGSWSDGVSTWSREINLRTDTSVTAQYSNLLIGKVGTAIFSDGCNSAQDDQALANSLVSGGPLQAAMQSYSYRTSLLDACGG